MLTHGALLGLSDDEAYYWVLAQKPALGYAFHPPAVAWTIALFQKLFSWLFGPSSSALVRLPAALGSAGMIGMGMQWLRNVTPENRSEIRDGLVLVSFCGFFALSWMMVPDITLFFGWTLLFTQTWNVCFSRSKWIHYFALGVGTALILLSKYSGILGVFSASAALLLWASPRNRNRGMLSLTLGTVAALIPIIIWNSHHEWASILYQIRDRHGGTQLSMIRWLRFFVIELVLAGPLTLFFTFWLLKKVLGEVTRSRNLVLDKTRNSNVRLRLFRYITVWILPAAFIFCFQPLLSDFKPHWAFVVWWPAFLCMAQLSSGPDWKWIKYQVRYGFTLTFFILLACHIPLGSWAMRYFQTSHFDPRLDVTNDLYGWKKLKPFLEHSIPPGNTDLPVVGSRYQTSSQAAFNLGIRKPVTFLPRDQKEWDEWPNLPISDALGPNWPHLKQPILFVGDNRYDAPPEFPNAKCRKIARLEESRFDFVAKVIDIWRCDP